MDDAIVGSSSGTTKDDRDYTDVLFSYERDHDEETAHTIRLNHWQEQHCRNVCQEHNTKKPKLFCVLGVCGMEEMNNILEKGECYSDMEVAITKFAMKLNHSYTSEWLKDINKVTDKISVSDGDVVDENQRFVCDDKIMSSLKFYSDKIGISESTLIRILITFGFSSGEEDNPFIQSKVEESKEKLSEAVEKYIDSVSQKVERFIRYVSDDVNSEDITEGMAEYLKEVKGNDESELVSDVTLEKVDKMIQMGGGDV